MTTNNDEGVKVALHHDYSAQLQPSERELIHPNLEQQIMCELAECEASRREDTRWIWFEERREVESQPMALFDSQPQTRSSLRPNIVAGDHDCLCLDLRIVLSVSVLN